MLLDEAYHQLGRGKRLKPDLSTMNCISRLLLYFIQVIDLGCLPFLLHSKWKNSFAEHSLL
jgi:hypothetical protein